MGGYWDHSAFGGRDNRKTQEGITKRLRKDKILGILRDHGMSWLDSLRLQGPRQLYVTALCSSEPPSHDNNLPCDISPERGLKGPLESSSRNFNYVWG